MSKRKANLIRLSNDGKKEFYVDAENAPQIIDFLNSTSAYKKKFALVTDLILNENRPPRDLYDKENIEKGCEHVTAIKLAKGKNNPRIYCQQFSRKDKKVFVIIACELLEKKKSQGLTNKEKQIIRKVAKYEYEFDE
ncbi:hypothetical protein [Nafulsella turpanensis]|uniref:hypothetical protein n=1 Tax=Nafulsella turpanensis TaxID=1265690 RepID=UPI00034C3B6D|nr:hypothetical protein [Nafulsella turpanensis]